MNDRIKKLREKTLSTQPQITLERAKLLTEFYGNGEVDKVSIPVARALAFKHLLLNKQLYVEEGELIVGERGPAPLKTPTYPEICTHSVQDFEILNSREKISFSVSENDKEFQQSVVEPFWKGRSLRDRTFNRIYGTTCSRTYSS